MQDIKMEILNHLYLEGEECGEPFATEEELKKLFNHPHIGAILIEMFNEGLIYPDETPNGEGTGWYLSQKGYATKTI